MEDRQHAVEVAFRNSWTSRVVPVHAFICEKDQAQDLRRGQLVIRAGPFNLLVLDLTATPDGNFALHQGFQTQPRDMFVDDMENLLVSQAVPVAASTSDNMGLQWKLVEYMPLKDFLADYCMTTIKAGMLIKVCSRLKVPKHSSLDHRHRVELYLRFMNRSEEFIEEVLAEIPVKPKKAKKEATEIGLPRKGLQLLFDIEKDFGLT